MTSLPTEVQILQNLELYLNKCIQHPDYTYPITVKTYLLLSTTTF